KAGDALGFLDRRVKGDLKRFKGFIEEHGHETGQWRGRISPSGEMSSGEMSSGGTSSGGMSSGGTSPGGDAMGGGLTGRAGHRPLPETRDLPPEPGGPKMP
ncbi:cyclase, partial [Streptomyces sp. NPDC058084]